MPTSDEIEAIHESGHAVSDVFHNLTFESVTLDDPTHGPHVRGEVYRKPADPLAPTVNEMDWIERHARATYAAHWAEKKAFGSGHRPGDRGDTEAANRFGPGLRSQSCRQAYVDEPAVLRGSRRCRGSLAGDPGGRRRARSAEDHDLRGGRLNL